MASSYSFSYKAMSTVGCLMLVAFGIGVKIKGRCVSFFGKAICWVFTLGFNQMIQFVLIAFLSHCNTY